MASARRIERVGRPKIVPSPDGRCVVVVALSAAPSSLWLQAFRYGRSRPPLCYPDLIRSSGQTFEFTSAEADVDTWVECIDAWIAHANRRYFEYRSPPPRPAPP